MMTDELKNIAILNAKGVHYKGILWRASSDEPVNKSNKSAWEDKGVL